MRAHLPRVGSRLYSLALAWGVAAVVALAIVAVVVGRLVEGGVRP